MRNEKWQKPTEKWKLKISLMFSERQIGWNDGIQWTKTNGLIDMRNL
jgi:hypothetical protein